MRTYNYLESIKEDVKTWLNDNDRKIDSAADKEELKEELYNLLWADDSVTGNGSGSYTCNRQEAKEMILAIDPDTGCDNLELLNNACEDFDCLDELGKRFVNNDWEYMDVTIRCYLLAQAIELVIEG